MSKHSYCPECGNNTRIACKHAINISCIECEKDYNSIIIEQECFFCLCEGETQDKFEYKPREIANRYLQVARLGKNRRKLGLEPPILFNGRENRYADLYELFMYGYKSKSD